MQHGSFLKTVLLRVLLLRRDTMTITTLIKEINLIGGGLRFIGLSIIITQGSLVAHRQTW